MRKPHQRWEPDEPDPEQWRPLVRDVLLPGAVAGGLGALGMALLAVGMAAVQHTAARPLLLVASVFHRESVPAGAGWALLGAALHLAVAGGVATTFAALLPRGVSGTPALGLATLYVMAVAPVMAHLVLPWAAPPFSRALDEVAFFVVHLPFAAALAFIPAVRGVLARLEAVRRRAKAVAGRALG